MADVLETIKKLGTRVADLQNLLAKREQLLQEIEAVDQEMKNLIEGGGSGRGRRGPKPGRGRRPGRPRKTAAVAKMGRPRGRRGRPRKVQAEAAAEE